MHPCIYCGLPKVDPLAPARYDVLNPLWSGEADPALFGPYCADCWPGTATAQTPPPEPIPPEPPLVPSHPIVLPDLEPSHPIVLPDLEPTHPIVLPDPEES